MNQIVEKKFFCTPDKKEYEIIYEFEIAYPGWECDSKGYIINFEGTPRLLLSDHGEFGIVPNSLYADDDDHIDYREGYDKRAETNRRIDANRLFNILYTYHLLAKQTNEAIDILMGNSKPQREEEF